MEDMSWATVERSDEALQSLTASESVSVLEVPELSDADIDRIEQELSSTTIEETVPQKAEPGSSVECETCGKTVRVRRDGFLTTHKCEPKSQRGNRLDHIPERKIVTPKKVRDFGIALISYGVEEGSASVLARQYGVEPEEIPTELPDAEAMIGPILDIVWPSIPDQAQAFIGKLADNADIIDCALAWWDWMRTISKWSREQRRYQQRLMSEREAHATSQPAGTFDGWGSVTPFRPAQP